MIMASVSLGVASAHAADAAAGWKVEVGGVRVVAPPPDGNNDLRAFNWSPGVTVSLVLIAPQGSIVSVDRNASKIDSFTDDKGTDLMTHDNFGDSNFSTGFGSNKAGKSVLVEAHGSGRPAKGATQFKLSGKVAVQTASQTKVVSADNVELKLGSELNLGEMKFTISGVRLQGKDFAVTLQSKQDPEGISHLEFYDASGAKIESHRDSSSSWGMQGDTTYNWEFTLKKQIDKAKIVATMWADLKTTEVPVSVKVDLGL
jgi:hypothetical protein